MVSEVNVSLVVLSVWCCTFGKQIPEEDKGALFFLVVFFFIFFNNQVVEALSKLVMERAVVLFFFFFNQPYPAWKPVFVPTYFWHAA